MALDLGPDFRPRIFGVQLAQFFEQLARALVPRIGGLDHDFDDLVAALIRALIQHALFAQTELLPVFGALRDLEQRLAVDGRGLDFGAERRFPDRDRELDLDVVTFAMEERVLLDARGNVQVARRRSVRAGVALAGDAEAGAVARAGGNPDFDLFGVGRATVAAAGRAGILEFAAAAALGTGQVEPHRAGHLGHVPGAFALRA